MKEKKFTLKTAAGCKRLIALFLIVILLSSFFANLVSSDGGKVKVSHLKIDARGAELDGDLYVPAGTSDSDCLPAVITIHGGGVVKGVMKHFAEELCRRGFVVYNINAYGQGLSEQPKSDDAGLGENGFDVRAKPLQGAWDAVDFLRSLKYVDKTKIGITGHSMGSRRAGLAAIFDCGYLTLNDMLVNELTDVFGVTLTEEEINTNADELAAKYLNDDQLAYFNRLKEEDTEYYNSRVKSICLLGSNANLVNPLKTVTVGGHEVQRNCQVDIGVITGDWDTGYWAFNAEENTKAAWYTNGQPAKHGIWYAVDDATKTSQELGEFRSLSVKDSQAFKEAVENRTARMCILNTETHSKNFFSVRTTADVVKFFEQTLEYNRGSIYDPATQPLDAENHTWVWRAIFNCIAMFSMLFLSFPLVGLMTKSPFFAPCVAEPAKIPAPNKKRGYIFYLATIVITFISIYIANAKGMSFFPTTWFWPTSGTGGIALLFVGFLAIGSILMLIAWAVISKKEGHNYLKDLNFGIGFKNVLKSLLMALIVIFVCYMTLAIISGLFNQDYRFWMMSFPEMKTEHWFVCLRFLIYFIPVYLLLGATTNIALPNDDPDWKDIIITVIVGSLGVWICCLINILAAKASFNGKLFSSFICSYQMLMFVPATIVISRKFYKLTNSVWVGAFINAMFLAWSFVGGNGLADGYYAQRFASIFFGV
ncbi:MAG: alpha/beta hydrolase [Oscillospiraceae bacterium]|nr:alpha/beta hydrolase [Oscillospiraceae bacterium]